MTDDVYKKARDEAAFKFVTDGFRRFPVEEDAFRDGADFGRAYGNREAMESPTVKALVEQCTRIRGSMARMFGTDDPVKIKEIQYGNDFFYSLAEMIDALETYRAEVEKLGEKE